MIKSNKIEKILGPFYKWFYLVSFSFKARTAYQLDNTLFALGQILVLLGSLLTWTAASGQELGDPDLNIKITYFIFGTILYNIINIWPSYYGYTIKRGQHTNQLLLPQDVFKLIWADYFGTALYQNIVTIFGILALSPLWFHYIEWSLSPISILLTLIILPLAHLILFYLELMIGLLAFFITEINGISLNYGFLQNLLSGRLFPLGILISSFYLNLANPFSYVFYQPVRILLNEINPSESLISILGAALWCIILHFFCKFLFKAGKKRNEAVGL